MGFFKNLSKIKKGYSSVSRKVKKAKKSYDTLSKKVKKSKTYKVVKKGTIGIVRASDRYAKTASKPRLLKGGDLLK